VKTLSDGVISEKNKLCPAARLSELQVDMGMSYEELGHLGNARKISTSGPLSTFERLLQEWDNADPGTGTFSSMLGGPAAPWQVVPCYLPPEGRLCRTIGTSLSSS